MPQKKINRVNDEFNLLILLKVLKSGLPIIIVLFVVAFFGAFFYNRYSQNIFQSSAMIQFKDAKTSKLLSENLLTSNENEVLSEKMEILNSSVFQQLVLSKLNLGIEYYNKGSIINTELYTSAPFEVLNIKFPSEYYEKPVFFEYKNGTVVDCYIKNDKQKIPLSVRKQNKNQFVLHNPKVQLQLNIENESISEQAPFFIVVDTLELARKYHKYIEVEVNRALSKTVQISVKQHNARKAYDILGTLLTTFKEYDLAKQQESATNIINYIDEELLSVEKDLYSSESSVNSLENRHALDRYDSLINSSSLSVITELNSRYQVLEKNQRLVSEIHNYINNESGADSYVLLSKIIGSEYHGTLSSILEKFQLLLIQRKQYSYNYTENSGKIKQLDYEIEIQKNILRETINTILENIEIEKKQITESIRKIRSNYKIESFKDSNVELSKIRRILKLNKSYFDRLLEARFAYSISRASYLANYDVLSEATLPVVPISPKKNMNYLMAFFLAFILAFAYLVFRYLFYNILSTVSDINKYTDASFLGYIPSIVSPSGTSQLMVDKNPKSSLAESLRMIRSNLNFINSEKGPKVITITSTVSGEGKTFIALNIAGIFTYSGKKVIILDLDMRKPKIHLAFSGDEDKVHNNLGMSHILAGTHTFSECVQESRQENLHFITAGQIPPNPSELILSQRFDSLISDLKQTYDYVILDTPPAGLISDGIKPLQVSDYPIYIFRSQVSQKFYIENLNYLHNELKIRNISYILNDVKAPVLKYGNYHVRGYTYGEEDTGSEKRTWLRFFKRKKKDKK